MSIDTDIHPVLDRQAIGKNLPQPWRRRYLDGDHGPGTLGYWNPNGVRRSDAVQADGTPIAATARSLVDDFMTPHGIATGVLNYEPANFALSPDTHFATAVCAATNDVLAEQWLATDSRLRASIIVPATDPMAAATEIRRVATAYSGFVQVLLPSATQLGTGLGHRFYEPVFEAASEAGLPVGIHPGYEGTGASGPPTRFGFPGSYLEWHTGLVAGYVSQLLSVTCGGTFQKFPDVQLVLIEGGVSWLPGLMWRLDKNWKGLRQSVPWLDTPPSQVIERHVRITCQPMEEPPSRRFLHEILAMFDSAGMLMFSSDFPHWDGDSPDFTGRWVPAEMRQQVLHDNAAALYGVAGDRA